jgi:hypothetical protein
MANVSPPKDLPHSASTARPGQRLVIPRSLAKREFGNDPGDRQTIIDAWRKGIFNALPAKGHAHRELLKAYVTTGKGARRILYVLDHGGGDIVFLMYRSKGDPIGANMSYKNPAFKSEVNKALGRFVADANADNCDYYSQSSVAGTK